jgi:BlaI family transcriptional regulator, penicillinase repressor
MKLKRPSSKPTEAQLDVLNILWNRGPLTVRQVHEELSQGKPSQYTTTLKIMQVMASRGLVARDERERSHVYDARITREDTHVQLASDLMNRVFAGSARRLLVSALGGKRASMKEVDELRDFIEEYRQRTRNTKK